MKHISIIILLASLQYNLMSGEKQPTPPTIRAVLSQIRINPTAAQIVAERAKPIDIPKRTTSRTSASSRPMTASSSNNTATSSGDTGQQQAKPKVQQKDKSTNTTPAHLFEIFSLEDLE